MPGTKGAALRRVVPHASLYLFAIAVTACSGGSGSAPSTPAPTLVSISVTSASQSVAAGLTDQFMATGVYSDSSKQDLTKSVAWTSGTSSVATVNASGLATSLAQGTSLITATSGTVSGSATLTVTAPQIVSLAIAPATLSVQLGATSSPLSAIATYTDKSTQDVSSSVTWAVSNPWIAQLSSAGAITGSRTGYTAVTAALGSLSTSAGVTVLALPSYLLVSSDAGRALTQMAVNANTGQPRFAGYQLTGNNLNVGAECLTIDPAGKYAYLASQATVSNGSAYEGLVNVYSIDATLGTLTPFAANPLTFSSPIGCINFEPSGKFAYAITPLTNTGNQLVSFSVNPDATLSLAGTSSLPNTPSSLAVDPLGQYLYIASADTASGGSAYASGFAIDASTGGLTPIAGTPLSLPLGTLGLLAFDPAGTHLYLSDANGTSIGEYAMDRTSGQLTAVASSSVNPCINPSALHFSPDGTHAYASCLEDNNHDAANAPLVSFSVASGGQLTQISAAAAGVNPGQMVVDPSGKFIYLGGAGTDYNSSSPGVYTVANNCVLVYQVGSDGKATLVNQIAGRRQIQSLLLLARSSPVTWSSTHAYVATAGDSKLTSYAVQADGSLSALQSLSIGATPATAAILQWGSDLLLATTAAAPNLIGYAVSNGALTQGWSFGLAAQPGGLVIDPAGQIAFNPDSSTGVVYEYGRVGSAGYWGTVNSTSSSTPLTYTAGAGAGPVTTDPAGRFLLVANQTAKSISAFEYAGAAPITPISLSYAPLALAMDPTGNWLFVTGDDQQLHLLLSNGLGQFTESASASLATNSPSIAIDPGAHFVYAAGAAGLSAFSINARTLALTPISLSLPVPLANATSVSIDYSGSFLYVSVSSNTVNALYRFNINADGTLSSSGTVQVASPNNATAVLFDGRVQ